MGYRVKVSVGSIFEILLIKSDTEEKYENQNIEKQSTLNVLSG